MPAGNYSSTLCAELNRLANDGTYPARSAFLDEQGAANKWAGTTGKSLVAALNIKNGVTNPALFKNLGAVCNALAGTTDKSPLAALTTMTGITNITNIIGFAQEQTNNGAQIYFMNSTSWGSKLSGIPNMQYCSGVDIAPTGKAAVFSSTYNPGLAGYAAPISLAGVGTAFSKPSGQGTDVSGFRFNKAGTAVAAGSLWGVWNWSDTTGYGTKFAGPATGLANGTQYGNGTGFNNADTVVAFTHSGATTANYPNCNAYAWSNSSGFGTKYAMPSPTQSATSVDGSSGEVNFTPSGNTIGWTTTAYPGNYTFQFTTGSGFGSRIAVIPNSIAYGLRWHPSENAIAVGFDDTGANTTRVYAWSGGTYGTEFSQPSYPQASSIRGRGAWWNPAGTGIAVAYAYGGSVSAWAWSTSGFGTIYSSQPALFGNVNSKPVYSWR